MGPPARRRSRNGAVSWAIAAFACAVFAVLFLVRADYALPVVLGGILVVLTVILTFRAVVLWRRVQPVDGGADRG